MRTVTYSGHLRALSSISHGGEVKGTQQTFRREGFVIDGSVHRYPVVSGGSIRGILRRTAATLNWAALGGEPQPYQTIDTLRWGGVLTAIGDKKDVLTAARQSTAKDALPALAVFGGTGGGRIISGSLCVDKAIPVAEETRYLADEYPPLPADTTFQSIYSLVGNESYSTVPDQPHGQVSDSEHAPPMVTGRMYYSYQTLLPGTLLWHEIVLENATPLMQAFFDNVMTAWERKARIGGRWGKGLGRVRPHYSRTVTDAYGRPSDWEGDTVDWIDWVQDHRDEAVEALSWLK